MPFNREIAEHPKAFLFAFLAFLVSGPAVYFAMVFIGYSITRQMHNAISLAATYVAPLLAAGLGVWVYKRLT